MGCQYRQSVDCQCRLTIGHVAIEYVVKLLRKFGILTTVEGSVLSMRCKAGLVNVEAVRAMKYLGEAWRAKGEERVAGQCSGVAKMWFEVVTGGEFLGMGG